MYPKTNQSLPSPGPIILFGSGETSASGQKVFHRLLSNIQDTPKISLLETPAGFEINSSAVIGRVANFINHNLQNFRPETLVIPARKRGTKFSPDDPDITRPLLDADVIFLGPGSPSYAVRQLRDSLAWYYLIARHQLGTAVVLASAATIAAGAYALPIYEIYKVGEDLHWRKGLDLFSRYGMPLVFIPHWNNNDGGTELDTSRCFMGEQRFSKLMHILPEGLTVIGIDEHTAMLINIEEKCCEIMGVGGVTIIHPNHKPTGRTSSHYNQDDNLSRIAEKRNAHFHYYRSGEVFPLEDWFPFRNPAPGFGVPGEVWKEVLGTLDKSDVDGEGFKVPEEIQSLVALRESARKNRDWAKADDIRQKLEKIGWRVNDTTEGPEVTIIK